MTDSATPATAQPLFILGCVRSGTTLIRDLLRRVPDTICPEETHYFRYGEPFRTGAYKRTFLSSKTLVKHREIDGVPAEVFETMLSSARTRGELLCQHVDHIAKARGLSQYRWIDKTPQNVYGLPLIRAEFPNARFLHLVRNPLNVVASLKLGKVLKVSDTHGACNYWLEAVRIVQQMRPLLGADLLEMRYEDFATDPVSGMARLLEFSGLDCETPRYSAQDAHPERNQFREILSQREQVTVMRRCGRLAAEYGYDLRAMLAQG